MDGPQELSHGRVDRTGLRFQGNNSHSEVGQLMNGGDDLPHVAAQTRDFPHQEAVELSEGSILLHLFKQRTALGTFAAGPTLLHVNAADGEFGNDLRIDGIDGAVTGRFLKDASGK